MAYRKFIKRGDKTFGPYYYESYRDKNGKVKTKYIGNSAPDKREKTKEKKSSKFMWVVPLIILLSLFIILIYNLEITGKITADIRDSYIYGENLSGDLRLNLKQGELLPIDSKLIILRASKREK